MSIISRELSEARILTTSSGKRSQTVLDCINDANISVTVAVRTRQAEEKLCWLSLAFQEIPNAHQIDSYEVLKAMLDHAPTERGKRYAACCIICCGEDRVQLVGLAYD
jgi:hypothetical protein